MPDYSPSEGEDNTDAVVESKQLMGDTLGAVAETEELAAKRMSRDRIIMWSPTAEKILHYKPVPNCITSLQFPASVYL